MIAIVDYGLGNVGAFLDIYRQLNVPVIRAQSANDLADASKLILPGVGSFDHAMKSFEDSGMAPAVEKMVQDGIKLLGVCVGMQMLADSSDEGQRKGLGWIPGRVRRFDPSTIMQATRLPHMGWNDLDVTVADPITAGLSTGARFYFLHSYYLEVAEPGDAIGESTYGITFPSLVRRGNVYGMQPHPEKSHSFGIRLLKNFSEL